MPGDQLAALFGLSTSSLYTAIAVLAAFCGLVAMIAGIGWLARGVAEIEDRYGRPKGD